MALSLTEWILGVFMSSLTSIQNPLSMPEAAPTSPRPTTKRQADLNGGEPSPVRPTSPRIQCRRSPAYRPFASVPPLLLPFGCGRTPPLRLFDMQREPIPLDRLELPHIWPSITYARRGPLDIGVLQPFGGNVVVSWLPHNHPMDFSPAPETLWEVYVRQLSMYSHPSGIWVWITFIDAADFSVDGYLTAAWWPNSGQ